MHKSYDAFLLTNELYQLLAMGAITSEHKILVKSAGSDAFATGCGCAQDDNVFNINVEAGEEPITVTEILVSLEEADMDTPVLVYSNESGHMIQAGYLTVKEDAIELY